MDAIPTAHHAPLPHRRTDKAVYAAASYGHRVDAQTITTSMSATRSKAYDRRVERAIVVHFGWAHRGRGANTETARG
ncbi:hypothetical protein [Streptomyces sp. 3N207]|uniref:hypothetical protein n=1 Tax=Streptomyces sp. 3N207 TaxID=3457417 RepID=UPI003FD3EE3A